MANCFPFIKYWYIIILFVFAFICAYNSTIEIVGFGTIFVLQTLFTLLLTNDILKDSNSHLKVLQTSNESWSSIPIWWILFAGLGMQFASSLLILTTTLFLYNKFQTIRLSHDNRWRLNAYKLIFLLSTIFMMILTFIYIQYSVSNGLSPLFRIVTLVCFVGILGLSSVDVIYANQLSKAINSTTDG